MVKQQHHFYAACVYGWATADTLEAALSKLARSIGAGTIKRYVERTGIGMLCTTTRVELPGDAEYKIDGYLPVNVPRSPAKNYYITSLENFTPKQGE